ncbi:metallo-hydrolase family protein [Vibrio cholerae]|jgi:beta-lactamase class A|nr:metallo-hydrolase family protein [Vibrio cholerae]
MRAVWAVVLGILVIVILVLTRPLQPPPSETALPEGLTDTPVAAAPARLDDDIAAVLDGACDCRVAVALADVSGGAARTFGDEAPFFAASTAKIITAAAYYHLVETGEASLDEEVGDYDAAFQLEAMVNNSSNDSWLLLMEAVGYPRLIDYAASLGFAYDPEENLLTAGDMASVLSRLYAGELLDQDNTAQLLGFMQETNNEELIPAASRPDVTVHHKYGQVEGELHDAALLTLHGSTFALVIYTESQGENAEADQVELIHSLTRAVEEALLPAGT